MSSTRDGSSRTYVSRYFAVKYLNYKTIIRAKILLGHVERKTILKIRLLLFRKSS